MKLTTEKINKLLGVDESFHASYKLIEILKKQSEREQLFNKFLEEEQDLSFDWFTEYFQAEHSDRKGKKQDFTPDGIVKVASGVLGSTSNNADIVEHIENELAIAENELAIYQKMKKTFLGDMML